MPTNDHSDKTESRRILDRVEQEADSSGLSRTSRMPGPKRATEGDDPIDAWATKVGRTLGLVVSTAILIWLVLYVLGKV